MSCDTIRTTEVALAKANPELLKTALASLGVTSYTFDKQTGRVIIRGQYVEANEINRAYSKTVLQTQAKKFGWSVQQQPDGKLRVLKAKL